MASVKVAVRVRPLNQREKDMGAKLIIQVDGKKTRINNLRYQDQFKDFTFDHSYWSFDENDPHFADQEQVFGDLGKDVVDAAFEGYNACVFAYGQTGSGKTFTMTGSPDKQGLIPRICESLFTRMASGGSYRTEVSYLEIYNERVKDLLREGSAHNLKVREHPRSGPYVSDLSRHLVSEYAHIQELMSRGNSVRTTASTNMNDTSSRSHAIFTLQFQQAGFSNDLPSETVSKVHLVDLAGSERADATGATGQRLKEGAHINKSLVTLGSVISALAELSSPPGGDSAGRRANVFIPYRDSVLTWLLKDSLGGNSKTIMIAAISPADCNHSETLSTLRYANRAKNIINKPTINEDPNVKLIKELRDEITKLRGLLGSDVSIETPQMLATLLKKEAQEKVLTEKWTEKWRETQKILQEQKALGLRKAAVGSGVVLDSDMPHLVGIDDNLLSTGVTLYHLKDGETVIGSSEAELRPDIVLSGVDLEEQHCSIVLSCGVASLVPRSSQALCWVNGSPVTKPTRLSQGCQILLGRNNMFRYNDPQEAEKLRKEGHASHNLSLSRLSLLSWSTNDLSLSQSSDNLISSCEDSEKVEELQHQKVEFLKQKEAFKLEQAEKEQDWEKEQQLKRGALELAQRQLEQERQQMEEAYEVQCRRLAEDWQRLEQRQAQSLARLRDREAELYKSRQLLQCERDEEIAAMGFEHKAMTDVKECIDMKKREFREFVTRQIQEVFSLNNNFLLPEDKIAPLSVLAAEKFCEGLCWLEMHSPSTSPHRESLPSWASLTATLKDGIVGEIVNHHREAISKLEAELNSRVQLLAKRENKIKGIDKQLEETRSRSSDIEISQEPTLDERTCLSPCSDHKLNVSQRKQMLRLELVPAGTDLPATHHSSPDTFHTAPSPSPPTHLSLHSPPAMSDSGLGLREDSDDLSSTTDDSGRHRTQLVHKKNSEKKSDEESISKSMNLLMQKMTRQRLHIIRSLESDLDSIDTNQEINLLQDLKKEYVRLEKKVEKRGKENNRSCEESGDASSSQDESGSLCDTVKYSGAKQSSQPPHNSFSMSTQNFSPYYNSSLDVRHRMLQNRLQPPLNPTVNSMDHIPPYNFSMARSMPALNPSFDPLLQPTIRALDYQQDSSVINRGRWEELEPSSGLLVRVPTYVLRGAGSSTHYAYEVRIHVAGDYWAVLRRYSRFRELHLQLKQTYGAKVGALAFPPRRLFSRQAEWLARERRPILERYLQSLIKLVATIPQSPLYTDISKPALLQLSPFFRRGVFESSKYGTS